LTNGQIAGIELTATAVELAGTEVAPGHRSVSGADCLESLYDSGRRLWQRPAHSGRDGRVHDHDQQCEYHGVSRQRRDHRYAGYGPGVPA
jgi:hypothetical protein